MSEPTPTANSGPTPHRDVRPGAVAPLEIFADIWCPFAYVGLVMVARQRDSFGRADVPVRVRAWPLEWVNQRPLDPSTTAGHVHELRHQVAPDLFAHFDPANFPESTLEALAWVAAAYRNGPEQGEALSFSLRTALFEEGRDISDPGVLRSLGAAVGVTGITERDRETVADDYAEGGRRGVIGSPHFFFGDEGMFCPGLTITKDADGHKTITADPSRLEGFLSRVFQR
jgi:predicted DsbA family dithiol-disulfide isomerase